MECNQVLLECNQVLLYDAVLDGNIAEVKQLMELADVDGNAEGGYALILAASYGHVLCVQFLAAQPGADPAAHNNAAIREAAEYGHLAVVEFLAGLDGVDPSALNNWAIKNAARKGHLDVVMFLLQTCYGSSLQVTLDTIVRPVMEPDTYDQLLTMLINKSDIDI